MKEYQLYTKEKLYTLGYLTTIIEVALLYVLYFGKVQQRFPTMYWRETELACKVFFAATALFAIYSITNIVMYLVNKARNKNNEILEESIKSEEKKEYIVE